MVSGGSDSASREALLRGRARPAQRDANPALRRARPTWTYARCGVSARSPAGPPASDLEGPPAGDAGFRSDCSSRSVPRTSRSTVFRRARRNGQLVTRCGARSLRSEPAFVAARRVSAGSRLRRSARSRAASRARRGARSLSEVTERASRFVAISRSRRRSAGDRWSPSPWELAREAGRCEGQVTVERASARAASRCAVRRRARASGADVRTDSRSKR